MWSRERETFNDEIEQYPEEMQDFVSAFARKLKGKFQEAEKDRQYIEGQWLKDLRQYKGKYDPEVLERIHPKRSKAFIRLTRTKVRAVDARMMDILFPSSGEKNWSITATTDPQFSPMEIQQMVQAFMAETGEQPPKELIHKAILEEADVRAEAMSKQMEDQLQTIKYRDVIRRTLHSGNIFGTGILKGPLVEKRRRNKWGKAEDGSWTMDSISYERPFVENVPVWDIYPDMSATSKENVQYIFQRHVMTKQKLRQLGKRDDFYGERIDEYIRANSRGDAEKKNHESQLHEMSLEEGGASQDLDGKYDVLEYWGYVDSDDLEDQGLDLPEEAQGVELAANVWMLGPMVIKIVLSPIEGVDFPYFFYYFEKDETSIFGEGVPAIMRDPQKLFNASVRAMLDNAAISAGPIVEANMDLLDEDEDPTDLYPFRVFQRTGVGVESQYPAIRVNTMPSYTNEYMQMAEVFSKYSDEATAIPRYMHGDSQGVSGAGRTASGLSMLMGSATLTVKDQIRYFDDGVTKPFISALYHWNMMFNEREDVKGDFEVSAEGSASMIAKEVRAEKLNTFLQATANPMDAPVTNRPYMLREIAKCMDLSEKAVKSDKEVADNGQQQQEFQQRLQAMQNALSEQDTYIQQLEQRVQSQAIDQLDEVANKTRQQNARNTAKQAEGE